MIRALLVALVVFATSPATADGPPELFELPGLFEAARHGDKAAATRLGQFRREGPVEPAIVNDSVAPVAEGNTGWDPSAGLLVPRYHFAPVQRRRSLTEGRDSQLWLDLQRLVARGRAAGLAGVLYDNRDEGHSRLRAADWPQLSFTAYSDAAVAAGLARGVNRAFRFDAPVIGNASVAMTSGFWRSMPRLAMTLPDGAARMFQLYAANHLYVFPEHADHDPEKGDMLPANQPYVLISQGSSYSDQPFIEALLGIVAALPPEVRASAEEKGLLAPLVQSVFRRGLSDITDDESYMSAAAHPSVYQAERIDLARMIALAQAMTADALPPLVWLSVISEEGGDDPAGLGLGGTGALSETLFNTPSAIARAWRGGGAERRMVLSAALTRDPNGRELRFHWRVIRGDTGRIVVAPRDETGRIVEITVPWHERAPLPDRPEITSQRVDIAVFADNGETLSAPAFVSWLFPSDQARVYGEVAGRTRLVSVDHRAGGLARQQTDPLIFPARDWQDRIDYDGDGRVTGWTRTRRAGETRFKGDGLRVVESDALGRPVRAEAVSYALDRDPAGRPLLDETGTGAFTVWQYTGPDDRVGTPRPE